jgi:hypothetical protein
MVNFQVMKIFPEDIEVLENLPAKTEIFHVSMKTIKAVASYPKGLLFESCRKF